MKRIIVAGIGCLTVVVMFFSGCRNNEKNALQQQRGSGYVMKYYAPEELEDHYLSARGSRPGLESPSPRAYDETLSLNSERRPVAQVSIQEAGELEEPEELAGTIFQPAQLVLDREAEPAPTLPRGPFLIVVAPPESPVAPVVAKRETAPVAEIHVAVVEDARLLAAPLLAGPELPPPRTRLFLPGDLTPKPLAEVIIASRFSELTAAIRKEALARAPRREQPPEDLWVKSHRQDDQPVSYSSPFGSAGFFRAP